MKAILTTLSNIITVGLTITFIMILTFAVFCAITYIDVKLAEPKKELCESKGGEWVHRSYLCFEKGTLIPVLGTRFGDTK